VCNTEHLSGKVIVNCEDRQQVFSNKIPFGFFPRRKPFSITEQQLEQQQLEQRQLEQRQLEQRQLEQQQLEHIVRNKIRT
jgi:hypothetical protein